MDYERHIIAGKSIYIVQNHAHILAAWADIRCKVSTPLLITLDHHTDSRSAFNSYMCSIGTSENEAAFLGTLICQIDYSDPQTVSEAVAKLRNDEHIDAALRADIISFAFIICNGGCQTTPGPYTNSIPKSKMFEVCPLCVPSCAEQLHENECLRLLADAALESVLLDDCLKVISEMSRAIGVIDITQEHFILDIDLDYFGTRQAIQPRDVATFYSLIRRAYAITIAVEPEYVEESRLDDEEIIGATLLLSLLDHIREALGVSA